MKIMAIESCFICPWIAWDDNDMPNCNNPDTLDRPIKDEMSVPKWCALDDLTIRDNEGDND